LKLKPHFLNPLVSYHDLTHPIDWFYQFSGKSEQYPLEVEIGFGLGEVLAQRAKEYSQRNFVGIEQIWERVYRTLKRINNESEDLDNIKILFIDAKDAFERLFMRESIDRIYSLFPCPWPKKKHVKHRLFSEDFLRLLNSRLKMGGELQIVTDDQAYFSWILEQVHSVGFKVAAKDIEARFNTKFEKKWKAEGQEKFFEIQMIKQRHIHVLVKEDSPLKGYKVDHFDPERFSFKDVVGEVTIICKQWLFDIKSQRGEVLLLVSEQELVQNVRVTIVKKEKGWRICRAEGQHFFPTPGIAKAIEAVYQNIKLEWCA